MTLSLAIIATLISISSLAISFRNFRRSQRLEFLQRRDLLLLKVADLSARIAEQRHISARFGIALINKVSSPTADDAHSEELNAQIGRLHTLIDNLDAGANHWDETLAGLHFICSNLTLNSDPAVIESLIARTQIASDDIKNTDGVYLASLHTLETTDPMLRASAATLHEAQVRQAELNLEESIRKLGGNS